MYSSEAVYINASLCAYDFFLIIKLKFSNFFNMEKIEENATTPKNSANQQQQPEAASSMSSAAATADKKPVCLLVIGMAVIKLLFIFL